MRVESNQCSVRNYYHRYVAGVTTSTALSAVVTMLVDVTMSVGVKMLVDEAK